MRTLHRRSGSSTRTALVALVALVLAGVAAGAAHAADAISPRDGDTVSSRPQFTFDFASGAAEVELSTSPDVRTAGDDIGAFVDRDAGDSILVGPGFGAAGAQPWDAGRIDAGRYFWHVRADPDGSATAAAWGPIRTLTVADEPAVFEGWTVRARRARTRGGCARVLVSGTIAWSDNAADATARYSVRVVAGGRTVKAITGTFGEFGDSFAGVACTRATQLRVTAALRDPGGHLSIGPARVIRVARP